MCPLAVWWVAAFATTCSITGHCAVQLCKEKQLLSGLQFKKEVLRHLRRKGKYPTIQWRKEAAALWTLGLESHPSRTALPCMLIWLGTFELGIGNAARVAKKTM